MVYSMKQILIVSNTGLNSKITEINKYFTDIVNEYDNTHDYKVDQYDFNIDTFDINELFKYIEVSNTISLVLHIPVLDVLIEISEKTRDLGLNFVVISDIDFGLEYKENLIKYIYESSYIHTIDIGDILNPYWKYIKFQMYHRLTLKND